MGVGQINHYVNFLAGALQMVVQGDKKRRWKAVTKLLYCLSDFPQLYIYSTSDHVIPSNAIKAWIQVINLATLTGPLLKGSAKIEACAAQLPPWNQRFL